MARLARFNVRMIEAPDPGVQTRSGLPAVVIDKALP
jgi:hypothetical protein